MARVKDVYISEKKNLVIHELDDVCDSATGRVLTGSWVWDSALILSKWMTTQSNFDFRGKIVVELGAGAGIPGITAALLGADRVILTDIEPLLHGLRSNVEANGLGDTVEVSRLVWGTDELPTQLSELGQVDLVLMSDVFFDSTQMAALAKTLRKICCETTSVWAASEIRPWTSEILHELAQEGFDVVELPSHKSEFQSWMTSGFAEDMVAIFQLLSPNIEYEHAKSVG